MINLILCKGSHIIKNVKIESNLFGSTSPNHSFYLMYASCSVAYCYQSVNFNTLIRCIFKSLGSPTLGTHTSSDEEGSTARIKISQIVQKIDSVRLGLFLVNRIFIFIMLIKKHENNQAFSIRKDVVCVVDPFLFKQTVIEISKVCQAYIYI